MVSAGLYNSWRLPKLHSHCDAYGHPVLEVTAKDASIHLFWGVLPYRDAVHFTYNPLTYG